MLDDHTPFARRGIPAIDLIAPDIYFPNFGEIAERLDLPRALLVSAYVLAAFAALACASM